MTAADLLADPDFAGLVFQHWHVTGDERQRAGDPCFVPRIVGEDLLDSMLARESEAFEVRALKWMRLPCEVCSGTGRVQAYQNGRTGTHPCPRGCDLNLPLALKQASVKRNTFLEALKRKGSAQYSDIRSDGGMDPRHAYEQARNQTATVEFDLSAAQVEGAIRDRLIELGWTPPGQGTNPAAWRKIAAEAYREWDADNDPRVGKLLKAMSESSFAASYRADIAALHTDKLSIHSPATGAAPDG